MSETESTDYRVGFDDGYRRGVEDGYDNGNAEGFKRACQDCIDESNSANLLGYQAGFAEGLRIGKIRSPWWLRLIDRFA